MAAFYGSAIAGARPAISATGAAEPELVTDKLHTETAHGWKFIAFGPDNKLYVPVGAPCNICDRGDEGFAQLVRMIPTAAVSRPWRVAFAIRWA